MRKRIISFALCVILVAGFLPMTAFANLQANITKFSITDDSVEGSSSYRMFLDWELPTKSVMDDGTNTISDDVEGVYIEYRNASAGESFIIKANLTNPPNLPPTNYEWTDSLREGSIYVFRPRPYHIHTYMQGGVTYNNEANYESSPPQKNVAYMTDIEVNATGRGTLMTVEWDNPRYDGSDAFWGYRIYYEVGGALVGSDFAKYVDVSIDEADPFVQNNKNRLRYAFSDADFIPGETYAVKVEPILLSGGAKGNLLRQNNGPNTIELPNNGGTMEITYKNTNVKEYRTNTATMNIPLDIYPDGEQVKLVWPSFANHLQQVAKIEIMSTTSDPTSSQGWTSGGNSLSGEGARNINYYRLPRPTVLTYYKIVVTFVDGDGVGIESEIVSYDPDQVNVTPFMPAVMADVKYPGGVPYLDIQWSAFVRKPLSNTETADSQGNYVDRNVRYDVWISDDMGNFNDLSFPKILDDVAASSISYDPDLYTYFLDTNEYYYKDSAGLYQEGTIETNMTYFIKVVAKKDAAVSSVGRPVYESEPGYASVYVPIEGEIATPPVVSKPPLRIKRDAAGKQMITMDSITIEWQDKWYEVYDSGDKKWYPVIEVNGRYQFVTDAEREKLQYNTVVDPDRVDTSMITSNLQKPARIMDISGSEIEILPVPLSVINALGVDYLTYLEGILDETYNPPGDWQNIGSGMTEHTISGLTENTEYVILFRALRRTSNGDLVSYPTYLIATTDPDDGDINIKPTVPVLEEVGHTDITAEVRWNYTTGMRYELAISEILVDDPGSARVIDQDTLDAARVVLDGIYYKYYTIDELFPDTGYYVWVRGFGTDSNSAWSNPIYIKTNPLTPPDPPTGLGKASDLSLQTINVNSGSNYEAVTKDQIIIEWNKDIQDDSDAITSGGGDGATVIGDESIIGTILLLFSDLDTNVDHFFRAKTVVTVTKASGGAGYSKTFAYVVQMSTTRDFAEYVEAYAPEDPTVDTSGGGIIQMESAWCSTIRIKTGTSDEEYDSEFDPDLVPLPEEDWEIIYDNGTGDLTFRFRASGTDNDGQRDNRVDQRFISKLVDHRTYTYGIDLTEYNNKEINRRIVEIPYTIMTAFDEHKINFKVKAHNITYTLPWGAVNTQELSNITGYGDGAVFRMIFAENPTSRPEIDESTQDFVSKPQLLSMYVITGQGSNRLTYLEKEAQVKMQLSNRYTILDNNVGGYTYEGSVAGWNRQKDQYDKEAATIDFSTGRIGVFTAIASSAPIVVGGSGADNMLAVNSKMHLSGISTYNPDGAISPAQFNAIAYAVINKQNSVDLSQPLTSQQQQQLEAAGLAVPSGTMVTREAGLAALAKLYERIDGYQIQLYYNVHTSPYSDMTSVSGPNQVAVLKAEEVGLIKGNYVNPQGMLTFEDCMYAIDMIMGLMGY